MRGRSLPRRRPTRTRSFRSTPSCSDHGIHVAGIAAGNNNTPTRTGGFRLSGIAPRAYLGNYKALGIPSEFGANGNSPELAAAIEAAVRDGMDVINMSLGETEIDPSRDLVATALNAAADAGVVSSVSAGNDFGDSASGRSRRPATREGDLRRSFERRPRQP